jgi:hypothetical protein
LIDPRTGQIDRAWFLFLFSLNSTVVAAENANVGPNTEVLLSSYEAALQALAQEVGTQPVVVQTPVGDDPVVDNGLLSTVAEMQKQIEGLQVQPLVDAAAITAAIAATSTAPVTKTADFTVASNETWLINNKSGSSCTVTLPAASSYTGRVLYFLNYQAQTLISASSDVVPLVGGAAGTAILAAVAGETCTLVSDGSNWLMTQYTPNNVLLLE